MAFDLTRVLLLFVFENVFNVTVGGPGGLQRLCAGLSLRNGSERVLDQSPMNAHVGDGSRHHPILLKQLVHGVSSGVEIVLRYEAPLRRFND